MATYAKNISTFTDYGAEAQDIERKRRMAELLQQQSMQPIEQQTGVPISWTQGLAKLLQGYNAGHGMKSATEAQKSLAARRNQAMAEALGGMPTAKQMPMEGSQSDVDQFGMAPQTELTQPTMQQNAAWLGQLAQIGPDATQIGGTLLGMQQKGVEADEMRKFRGQESALARQARMDQIEREIASGNLTKERDAALRRELRQQQDEAAMERKQAEIAAEERMRRFMVANRQPRQEEAPIAVMIDGKPTLVSRQDAIGKTPAAVGKGAAMSSTAQKELIQTDEEVAGGVQTLGFLKQAKDINDKAMGFMGAGAVSSLGTLLPQAIRPSTVDATQNLDNILQNSALPSLKAIFGGNPTEGERKVLLEVQGSSNKSPAVRKAIFDRAEEAVKSRLKFATEKAKSLRSGTYFSGDGGMGAPATPAIDDLLNKYK